VTRVEEEGRILAQYRALAENLGDSPPRFLLKLILSEEELHHELLRATARWLREHSAPEGNSSPLGGNPGELPRHTELLQGHETETIEACRRLRADLSGTGGELLASVLDVMVMDSEKHHRLLTTVRRMISR
jgi:hypothetical protein